MEDKRFGLGVFLYVFNQNLSKVLLLKLNETKRNKFNATWGNVGGKMNFGEMSLETCVRETEEEIGIRFNPEDLKLLYVKEMPDFYKNIHGIQFVYGTSIDEQMPITISKELESYQWFSLTDLPERTLDSKDDYHKAYKLLSKMY